METIYKTIYRQPEIQKRLRTQVWALICTAIGVIALALMLTTEEATAGVSSLLLGLIVVGAFGLVSLICYYTFGDCQAPYHKPSKKILEAEEQYYAIQQRQAVLDAVNNGDRQALQNVKKSNKPEIIVVSYSDDAEEVVYFQVIDNTKKQAEALTEIIQVVTKKR